MVASHEHNGNHDYLFAIVSSLKELCEKHDFIFVAPNNAARVQNAASVEARTSQSTYHRLSGAGGLSHLRSASCSSQPSGPWVRMAIRNGNRAKDLWKHRTCFLRIAHHPHCLAVDGAAENQAARSSEGTFA